MPVSDDSSLSPSPAPAAPTSALAAAPALAAPLIHAEDAWACRLPRISRAPGVYIVHCAADGRCYIGSTTCLRTRYSTHWSKLRRRDHENARLQAAWAQHGPNAVRFGVLEELPGAADDASEPLRLARENYWLSRISRASLYNVAIPATASLRTTPASKRTKKSAP